ncbi:hypothetical protein GN958_ATG14982 [Phytophthora infestans]|uniref:Uncharacterized protein n=1 Tax=Phytophthora infestans TaxID=4787 RepID=A0A8S9UBT3_PHYIN|nr:hypothetical protein GN958_ATG14982 [Phytophthora infestans]
MSEAKDSVVALLGRNWSSSEEDSKDHSDAIAVGDAQAMVPASLNTPSIRRLPTQRIFGEGVRRAFQDLLSDPVQDLHPGPGHQLYEERPAASVTLNAQQRANQARKPQSIQNWVTNFKAQEAVLESYSYTEAHIAPYEKLGARVAEAAEHLRTSWGYTANHRTIQSWVESMLKEHVLHEREHDAETGQEHERSAIEIRIREKLTEMVEQQKDHLATKTSNAAKRKRDGELRDAGLRHRENVARTVYDKEVSELGGRRLVLTDDGAVAASSDESDGTSVTKRQRRNPKHQLQMERLLEEDREQTAKLQERRLDLKQNQFNADLEMRKEEIALRRQELKLRHTEIQNANQQKLTEMEMRQQEFQMRQQEFQVEIKRKQDQSNKEFEFKLKKLELMLKDKTMAVDAKQSNN